MSLLADRVKEYGLLQAFYMATKKLFKAFNLLYIKYCPYKIKQNKIIFSNFSGLGYGNDPKYIAEKLKNNKNLDLVWVVRDNHITGIPDTIRTVKLGSVKYYYEMSTAKVWVDNERKTFEIRKRNGQFYLQTWHGFIPLKKIEKDTSLPEQYIKDAKNDSKMIDLIPSSCESRTRIYRESFWYDGEIAACGSPRLDILMNRTDTRNRIYSFYHIDKNKKLVIYAPTFRKSHSLKPYAIDFLRVKRALESRLGGEYICMVRLHPGMKDVKIGGFFGEHVLDGSKIAEAQELFAACDVLISDYSDSLFEAALAGKKVFIFASDIEEYLKERDFYMDYYSLPFAISANNEELEHAILSFDMEVYEDKIRRFWEKQGLYKCGNSAEYLAEWILNKTEGKE
ncbi:MAG: hypothetical protein HFG65_03225 [Hungatella sp.]|nr:hypothetical protein [Hungatella sp.]